LVSRIQDAGMKIMLKKLWKKIKKA
jgi:hypothetical protein